MKPRFFGTFLESIKVFIIKVLLHEFYMAYSVAEMAYPWHGDIWTTSCLILKK